MMTPPTMTAVRFEQAINQLGWTKRGASHFFGITERTIARWVERNQVARPVAMVLELMLQKKITPLEVLTIAKVRQDQIEFIMNHLHDNRVVDDDEEAEDE